MLAVYGVKETRELSAGEIFLMPWSSPDVCTTVRLPRNDSQRDCVRALALVRVLSEADVAIIILCVRACVRVCVILFSVIIICNFVYNNNNNIFY